MSENLGNTLQKALDAWLAQYRTSVNVTHYINAIDTEKAFDKLIPFHYKNS